MVKHGWVTLEGTVDWDFQRIAAAECVHYLMGVAAVTNLILVKPTATWAAPGVSSVVTEIAVVS